MGILILVAMALICSAIAWDLGLFRRKLSHQLPTGGEAGFCYTCGFDFEDDKVHSRLAHGPHPWSPEDLPEWRR